MTLALASCGDDGGAPSKELFIRTADAICAAEAKRGEALIAARVPDPANATPRQILGLVHAFSRIRRETVARIARLERPEGDSLEIQDWIFASREALDQLEEISRPRAAIAALEASGTRMDPFYEANKAAEEYGLDECVV